MQTGKGELLVIHNEIAWWFLSNQTEKNGCFCVGFTSECAKLVNVLQSLYLLYTVTVTTGLLHCFTPSHRISRLS